MQNKDPPISETAIDIEIGGEGSAEMAELSGFFAEVGMP